MARLTDNNGVMLGGLETSLSRLVDPPKEPVSAAVTAPASKLPPPEYGTEEIIFALQCSFGSLATLGFSAAPPAQTLGTGCINLIEEPEERHYCAECGGYYCRAHAGPVDHDCKSVMRV